MPCLLQPATQSYAQVAAAAAARKEATPLAGPGPAHLEPAPKKTAIHPASPVLPSSDVLRPPHEALPAELRPMWLDLKQSGLPLPQPNTDLNRPPTETRAGGGGGGSGRRSSGSAVGGGVPVGSGGVGTGGGGNGVVLVAGEAARPKWFGTHPSD